jgi:hypothetical protein
LGAGTGRDSIASLPGLLGFLLFDVVLSGSVVVASVNVVRELGWPEVLTGNLLAELTVLYALHRVWGHAPDRRGRLSGPTVWSGKGSSPG